MSDCSPQALAIEEAAGITICHETHRGRILYNPWVTRAMCTAFPRLKLTADLSHFCVVAERVFGDDDADWKSVMAEVTPPPPVARTAEAAAQVARATHHIHARVGYAEGPQVPDPRAPEYATALEAHEKWWDQILSTQVWATIVGRCACWDSDDAVIVNGGGRLRRGTRR